MTKDVADYNITRRLARGQTKTARKAKRKAESMVRSNKKRKFVDHAEGLEGSNLQADHSLVGDDALRDTVEDTTTSVLGANIHVSTVTIVDDIVMSDKEENSLIKPPIITNLTIGINAVTKKLEALSRPSRLVLSASAPSTSADTNDPIGTHDRIKIVLICRADVESPLLVAHLPHLIAACNSYHPALAIKLVQLPKDAERALAETLGLRRAAVVALNVKLYSLRLEYS